MDVPEEDALQDEDDKDDDENGEQVGLVVQDTDGLRRGADAAEPVELTHCVVCVVGVKSCVVGRIVGNWELGY